ncbi:MAG: CehA/McbA family metallohydrolase [Lachnospiraceae bacterium]|nr:CehA/McbA family metallohydrolase [Lachnospiraceae bacterium]
MVRTTFLNDPNAVWLKGNLHSHSTNSDGKLTIDEMRKAYIEHGYDFLAISDHDFYSDTRALSDDKLTMIQGFELYGNATDGKDIHLHFLWEDAIEGIEPNTKVKLPERTGEVTSRFSYDMRKKGAFVQLNHPHWSMLASTEVEDENPYHAVEIINYGTEWLENTGDGSVFWSEMLYRGVKLWGTGSDDNHNGAPLDDMYSDSFGGFTVVKARDRSPKAIMEALFNGSFYTSTGPSIYDFYLDGDEIHVVCSPCERIFISGHTRPYQRKLGRHVTEFVTKLKGSEKLVRAECMDAAGRSAYTNPIYLT